MTSPPSHPDLVALALGELAPEDREHLEARIRADADVARRYREITEHLHAYDALPDAAPPPFETLERRLATATARARPPSPRRTWAWGAGAAAVAAAVVLVLLVSRPAREDTTRASGWKPGPGLRARGSVWSAEDENVPLEWPGRVAAVLGRGTRVALRDGATVELLEGIAFFDVARGPFTVRVRGSEVAVRGTRFEVEAPPERPRAVVVRVEEGVVDVDGATVRAGETRREGRTAASTVPAGAFFRRPTLTLSGAVEGAEARFAFHLVNPGRVAQPVPASDGPLTSLWLSLTTPTGAVRDLSVPEAPWQGGEVGSDGHRIPPGERVRREAAFPAGIFSEKGVYRCRAMYRPEGRAPLISDEVRLEVR